MTATWLCSYACTSIMQWLWWRGTRYTIVHKNDFLILLKCAMDRAREWQIFIHQWPLCGEAVHWSCLVLYRQHHCRQWDLLEHETVQKPHSVAIDEDVQAPPTNQQWKCEFYGVPRKHKKNLPKMKLRWQLFMLIFFTYSNTSTSTSILPSSIMPIKPIWGLSSNMSTSTTTNILRHSSAGVHKQA